MARGVRAWPRIKSTAAEQRQLWREVGTALALGKNKVEREPGQTFAAWCQDQFPGTDQKNDVPAAIWLATEFPSSKENEVPTALSSPQHVRQWFNAQTPAPAPAPDVDLSCMKVNPELAHIAAEEQESTAASRERWKLIGEALKVGREAHAGNQAFGAWCTEHEFGGIDRRVRADALWFAANTSLSGIPTTLANPGDIRKAYAKLTAPVKPKVYVEARVIQRVAARPPLTVHDAHLIEAIGSKVRRINALAAHAVGEGPEAAPCPSTRLSHSAHRELDTVQQRGIVEARAVLPKLELTAALQCPRRPLHGSADPQLNRPPPRQRGQRQHVASMHRHARELVRSELAVRKGRDGDVRHALDRGQHDEASKLPSLREAAYWSHLGQASMTRQLGP